MAISKVSYNNTPQAHDDKYQIVSYTGAIKFNVMLNDQGGNAKTMYSIDDGSSPVLNGGPADLLTQDTVSKSTGKSAFEYSHLGAKIWINADGTVSYDAGALTMPPAGTSVVDSFIYAIRMADGTLSWGTVNVVLGNHAAVVTGPVTGTAIEDGPAVALNALANASDDFTTNLGVHFDLSSLPSGVTYDATTHSFVLDPSNGAYQHLAAGQQTTVTVNYSVWDGYLEAPTTASWLVTGVNDAASINGTNTGGVKEDVTLSAGGTLAVSDVDDGEATFAPVATTALHGVYGDFTFDAGSGAWTYALANGSDAVQTLGEGVTVTDTLTVTSKDGTASKTITVTVTGTNDAPVVSAPVTGTATEDGAVSPLDALANATDKDVGDVLSVTGLPSTLPDGVTYDSTTHTLTLDPTNAGYQHLAAGDHATVTVDYQVTDGYVNVAQTASWDVTGVNDPASIDGTNTGDVKEDSTTMTAGGTIAVSDVDDGENVFQAVDSNALNGTYGTFTFDNGVWTYTLANDSDAVQTLGEGVTETDTLTVTSKDGTASKTITVTVTGTNDAPVVSAVTGTATEDGSASSLDALANATDKDVGDVLSVTGLPSTLPDGVTYDSTTHTLTLDPTNAAYQHLAAGAHETVTVNYQVTDGYVNVAQTASWDVTGVNDPASIDGTNTGDVKEDTTMTAGGTVAVSDVDDGENVFQAVDSNALNGTYGTFTFDNGVWTYTLANDSDAVQTLGEGVTETDTLTVTSKDGTASKTITVTVTGTNDAPVVSAPVTGTATEDGSTSTLNALANATDKDTGDVLSVTGLPSTLPDGVTYDSTTHSLTLDPTNAAYQHLAAGDHATVTVNYQVTDGYVNVAQTASWDVTGVNDPASIDGTNTGGVKEDGTTTANGTLSVSDADDGEEHFQAVSSSALQGTYGTFTFSDGAWTYTLDNSSDAVQSLGDGVQKQDTLAVKSQDGTATDTITVTVTGTNDAPVVSGPLSANATEDGVASTVNALANATDKDTGDVLSATGLPTTLPAGVTYNTLTHTFALDPTNAAYQHLAAGQHTTVSMNYGVTDGIATANTNVSWDVVGVNDTASMGGTYTGSVTEDGTLVATGALTVSDVDDGQNGYATVPSLALHGTYGNFTFDGTTGNWSYTLRNSDANVQALNTSDHVNDSLTVSSIDGTASETIQITVNGADEPIVVNLITTFQITHGANQSDHQTITGFDSNDLLKLNGQVSFTSFHTADVNNDGKMDTVVQFMDNGGNHSVPFDVTLLGYSAFNASTQIV